MDIKSFVRPNVRNLKPYSSARDEFSINEESMIYLDANENPFETNLNRYPDPQQKQLKAKVASIKKVNSNQILLGNGSDEVLDLIFRCFCEPGIDNVIIQPPTYGMYKVLATVNNVEVKEVLLTEAFQIDVQSVLNAIDINTKLIFICSPNNPSGNNLNANNIREIASNFSGIVVIDEAYIDFTSNESWIKELEKHPNIIVIQTFSKAYGMAGIRLGMCFASPQIINYLNKIKPPYNINMLTQIEGLKQLNSLPQIEENVNVIIKERDALEKMLINLSFVEEVYPSNANFLLIKVDDATKRYQQLVAKNIVVRNRTNQPLCNNTLRITIGTPFENNTLLTVLKEIENE